MRVMRRHVTRYFHDQIIPSLFSRLKGDLIVTHKCCLNTAGAEHTIDFPRPFKTLKLLLNPSLGKRG